jgi:bla regulator protein BlaR1
MSPNLPSPGSWSAHPVVESLGWSLVHFLWQGTVVSLLLAILLLALRRATPGVRYLAAGAGLLLMGACPIGTLVWSWSLATHQPVVARYVHERSPTDRTERPRQIVVRSEPASAKPAPAAPSSRQIPAAPRISVPPLGAMRPLLPWLVAAWLTGVFALSARLCAGWIGIQRMRRLRVRPVTPDWEVRLRRLAEELHVSRPVRLLESALVEVPAVIGCLRPVILLPASSLVGLSPRQLEAILAHELAHVRRHDYLVNLFQTVLETLLFYHPAV